ncbi:putative Inner membrane protein YghQ [uncultured Alphaproteobacteria bacterium]|uniref:Putative Inner membrane protein YghQ n=1 Tax=uncultured Alphaproteobacteria bacterium TaxID=91750 RepID=A0A212K7Q9_9PROT|nr:putative Inner membrane protein YghQ [uncultured Alphaproteobacteria bacterium]
MTVRAVSEHRATSPAGGIVRRAARNLAYLTGGKSVSGLLSLIYLAVAVQTLGIDVYGQLILIYSFAQLVTAIVQFQTWQPILHFGTAAIAEDRLGDFRSLVRFAVGLDAASSLVGMAVVAGGIWLVGPHIDLPPETLPFASGFALAVPFMAWATPNGLLRLFDRFDLLLLEDNVEAAVRLAGSLLVLALGGGLVGFVLVWAASVVASGSACALLAWREVRRRNLWAREDAPGAPVAQRFPGIWAFIWSTNFNSTLKLARPHLTTLLIGGALESVQAGLFRVAQQIADALATPLKLMVPVIYPELARLVAARDFDLLRAVSRRTLVWSGLGAVATFAALAALGPLLLDIIGGDEADGAYGMLLLLSAAALIRISGFSLEPMLISLGHPSLALAVQTTATVIYFPALLLLLAYFSFNGAGFAAIGAATLTVLLQLAAVAYWFPAEAPAAAAQEARS